MTPSVPWAGDSGSSGIGLSGAIVGVHSLGGNSDASEVRADRFSSWATTMIANPQAFRG